MADAIHYLDNAATTRPCKEAMALMAAAAETHWANPASLYRAGAAAEGLVDAARARLAKQLGCAPKEVVFTAGGTEANNIAILGAARFRAGWGNHIVATGYEHPSAAGPLRMLADEGFALTEVMPNRSGSVEAEKLVAAVGPKTVLVCAMHVNNENGAILDVAALASAVKAKNPRCFVHADGIQAFCKLPFSPVKAALDSYSTSGHKLHGPKGVGALYLRGSSRVAAPMLGGGQEFGLRPGTPDTARIAAYAEAVRLAAKHSQAAAQTALTLRKRLLDGLAKIDGIEPHLPQSALANILIFSMPKGLRSQVMLNFLDDNYRVMVSSGSACSGGAASRTLTAMGLPAAKVDAAIRVSFCRDNSFEDVDALLSGLADGIAHLARS